MDNRPRPNLGQAIRRTAAERELLSQITPNDIFRARRLFLESAPPAFASLIEARPEPRGSGG